MSSRYPEGGVWHLYVACAYSAAPAEIGSSCAAPHHVLQWQKHSSRQRFPEPICSTYSLVGWYAAAAPYHTSTPYNQVHFVRQATASSMVAVTPRRTLTGYSRAGLTLGQAILVHSGCGSALVAVLVSSLVGLQEAAPDQNAGAVLLG